LSSPDPQWAAPDQYVAAAPVPVPAPPAPSAFCRACGTKIDARAAICPSCGVPTGNGHVPGLATPVSPEALINRKSGGTAILLSLLFTGAGHWYCGETGRGFAFLGGAIAAALMLFLVIGFIALPAVWIWAAIDANKAAERHNRRLLAAAQPAFA
jgi:TM2 domain-containing membrane protein YozV